MLKLLSLALLLLAAAGSLAASENSVSTTSRTQRSFSNEENARLGFFIKLLLNSFKAIMPNGIPELDIPPLDPLDVQQFSANMQEGLTNVTLKLDSLRVVGLSDFVVREAQGNLGQLAISLDIFMPEVTGIGQYDLDGQVIIFPLFGNGTAAIKVNDLHFKGTASISMIGSKLKIHDLDLDVVFSQIQVFLENIGGGGNLGNLVNSLANMLGKSIYDNFKDTLLTNANRMMKDALNSKLADVDINDIIGGILPLSPPEKEAPTDDSVDTYVDMIMENLRPYMREKGLDPLELPAAGTTFSKRRLGIRLHGGAQLRSGQLHSLSSIHRVGSFDLRSSENRVTIAGSIGIRGLWGSLQASAWFMKIGISPHVQFSLESLQASAKISVSLTQDGGQFVQLDEFGISNMADIRVRIDNMGVLGWALSPLANLAVNLVRGRIISAIEDPIRQQIVKQLASIDLPASMLLD